MQTKSQIEKTTSLKLQWRLPLLLILPLLLLSTCKKDKGNPPEPCPCEGEACIDEMMAFTYFLPGTWWMYEEQTSGDRDSVYVYEASSSIGSDGSHHFIMRTHSTFDEYNYYYQFTESLTQNLNYPQCPYHNVKRTKTRPGDFVGTGTFFFAPIFHNDFKYDGGGGVISVDSVWIDNGGLLEEVYFDIDNCRSEEYSHSSFKLRSHIGIVRKTQFEQDRLWNLVEFNIVQ